MSYHIIANFPSDRNYKGTLKVYDDSGSLVFGPVEALGRGDANQVKGGDYTNWRLQNANIPTGEAKTKIWPKGSSEYSYGPYERVYLYEAIGGNFLIAEQNGRSQIMIHGGAPATNSSKPYYPLRPTYGCIRLSNSDQKELIQVLEQNGRSGKITISEI